VDGNYSNNGNNLFWRLSVFCLSPGRITQIRLSPPIFLSRDAFIERIVKLLPWCSSVRLSVCLSV